VTIEFACKRRLHQHQAFEKVSLKRGLRVSNSTPVGHCLSEFMIRLSAFHPLLNICVHVYHLALSERVHPPRFVARNPETLGPTSWYFCQRSRGSLHAPLSAISFAYQSRRVQRRDACGNADLQWALRCQTAALYQNSLKRVAQLTHAFFRRPQYAKVLFQR
jgi:hypothetical protein